MAYSSGRKANAATSDTVPFDADSSVTSNTTFGTTVLFATLLIPTGASEGCSRLGGHAGRGVVRNYKSCYDAGVFVR